MGVSVIVSPVSARGLLPTVSAAPPVTGAEGEPKARKRPVPARIWLLAVLALLVMLCEGAANDWSVLHLKTVLDTPESTAAFAYGAYAATVTVGRLLADRISARFGPAAVLKCGTVPATLGITVVALSPWIRAAPTGSALFGPGLSGCVPQLFSAAGHTDAAAAGANVSRAAGLGCTGMLAGPDVRGWLTHLMALNHTFLLLTLFRETTTVAAGILRPPPDRPRTVGLTS